MPSSDANDDDDEWQAMPVESSSSLAEQSIPDQYANPNDIPYGDEDDDDSSDPDDPRRFRSWPSRGSSSRDKTSSASSRTKASATLTGKAKKRWIQGRLTSNSSAAPTGSPPPPDSSSLSSSNKRPGQAAATNATGRHLDIQDARGYDWRSKPAGSSSDSEDEDGGKEKGYTQLRLDEDEESEQLHAATEYLFQDGASGPNGQHDPYGDSAATPISQMKTTKQLLSEGQKIAYVGLCSLASAAMVRSLRRVPGKELDTAKQSIESWKVKVMARLYQHMDIESSEQNMIESLAGHGVLPTDLAPSLITTQTISNPDFDPEALREREEEEREEREELERKKAFDEERNQDRLLAEQQQASHDPPPPYSQTSSRTEEQAPEKTITSEEPTDSNLEADSSPPATLPAEQGADSASKDADQKADTAEDHAAEDHEDEDDDDGDIGGFGQSKRSSVTKKHANKASMSASDVVRSTPASPPLDDFDDGDIGSMAQEDSAKKGKETGPEQPSRGGPGTEPSQEMADDGSTDIQADQPAAEEQTTPKPRSLQLEPVSALSSSQRDDTDGGEKRTTGDKAPVAQAEPILADPNTASQISNAIDASAALKPAPDVVQATGSEPAQSGSTTTTLGLTKQPQAVEPPPGALDGVTTTISSADRTITLDLRWTVLCDLFLVLTADSVYDARSRVLLETVAAYLGLTWMDVTKFEKRITDALEIEEGVESLKDKGALKRRMEMARKKRLMMMGLATVGGGLVIGLSAGLLAPVIGAGVGAALGAVGIGGTSGFLGGVGGAALITTTGTVGGMSLGGRGMSRRTRSVKTFEFKSIHNNKRVNAIITVPGFMSGPQDDVRLPFSVIDSVMGDLFSILWEPDMMQEMGNALGILWNETLVQGVQQVLAATVAGAMFSALAWPLWLTKLGYLIDNPWSNALDRSQAAGLILADILSRRQMGVRPITLVGYSLGARAIFYCLLELARTKSYGIVQNVYIMGAPITAKDDAWKMARSVVAGRFVSAFSRTDWILGYLHRAASGGMRSIAGLHPVERVQDIENVDVTHVVPGHLQYRALMPLVLSELGFKTSADYFDEPEDLSKIPERQIVREDPEYELKTVKTKTGGFGTIWRRKGENKSNDSSKVGSPSGSIPGTPTSREQSRAGGGGGAGGGTGEYDYDYDEDDIDVDEDGLPRRLEDHPTDTADSKSKDIKETEAPAAASAPAAAPAEKPVAPPISIAESKVAAMDDPRPRTVATPEADKPPSYGVHFDTEALLAELRESGIEVKELESSLPPLVASTTDSASKKTPESSAKPGAQKEKLELPSAAFSADRTPSPSASKAATESRFQPPVETPSAAVSSIEPAQDSADAPPQKQPAPYPRSFSSYSTGSSSDSAGYERYQTQSLDAGPTLAGDQSGVSLSFASYDDDEIEVAQPSSAGFTLPEDRLRGYGLTAETAKELEAKFRGGGGIGVEPSNLSSVVDPAAGSWATPTDAGGWGGGASFGFDSEPAELARPNRPYDSGAGRSDSLSTFGVDAGGFGLAGPSSSSAGLGFGSQSLASKASLSALDESFVRAATSSSHTPSKKSSTKSGASAGMGADPWADNPWGGNY